MDPRSQTPNPQYIIIIIIIPREGVGGALGATARKPSLYIWMRPNENDKICRVAASSLTLGHCKPVNI